MRGVESISEPTQIERNIRILCVDDHEANLTALQAVLSAPDRELVMVRSGKEAIEQLSSEAFAVILLDVEMPVMDGFEVARRIRQIPSARTTPIIFLTAIYPDENSQIQGYEAGAVDYLLKPLNTLVLRAKVNVFVQMFRKNLELRRQAELLRQVDILREAVRIREEFLAIASHELRTPITPLHLQLQGFIYMIETGKLEHVTYDKLKEMLEVSDSQVSRLARLVSQLLDASRIDAGRMLIERHDVNLAHLVEDVLVQLRYEIEASECRIALNLDPQVHGNWDRLRIEQVLINLLTNAMKYAEGKPIEIKVELRKGRARLSVKDYGIGIATEDQQRIFDRFERAVSSKHFGGLGLGLYVAKQIVQLHGGQIHVDSELGRGATFIIEIPTEDEKYVH